MKTTTALILLAAAAAFVGPAGADETRAQTSALKTEAPLLQHDLSSRHRHWRHDGGVSARVCRGFTIAPTELKTWGDRRWPYVNWRGACDSLYAPGPFVTFVGYGSY